jgi:NTE family protein
MTVALALAGGNALGAYAAGAYEALHQRAYLPDLISGASIGAVTGAIIAGNVPENRIARLHEFWRQAGFGSAFGLAPASGRPREMYNLMHSLQTLALGRPGLFTPRLPGLLSILPGMPPDTALFDSKPLTATLERVIDFEVLNSGAVPMLIGTVDMENGESVIFDTRRTKVDARHFLASTAFTPGFPPVEIDGRCLADPGLISNLPYDAILDPPPADDLLCFAVDLFDANGARPHSVDTGLERAQDIVFSTQALRTLDARAREHQLRHMLGEAAAYMSPDRRAQAGPLLAQARFNTITVVLVAYRAPPHELSAKTVDFSRASLDERWATGRADMNAALDMLATKRPTSSEHGFTLYDGRRAAKA